MAAWARDFGDVSPLKGVIFGESVDSYLEVAVDVTRVDPLDNPAAPLPASRTPDAQIYDTSCDRQLRVCDLWADRRGACFGPGEQFVERLGVLTCVVALRTNDLVTQVFGLYTVDGGLVGVSS